MQCSSAISRFKFHLYATLEVHQNTDAIFVFIHYFDDFLLTNWGP